MVTKLFSKTDCVIYSQVIKITGMLIHQKAVIFHKITRPRVHMVKITAALQSFGWGIMGHTYILYIVNVV